MGGGKRGLRLPTPLPNPFGNLISFPPLLLPPPNHFSVLLRLFKRRRAPQGGRAAAPRRSPGRGSLFHEARSSPSRASGAAAGPGHGPAAPLPHSGAAGAARPPPSSLRALPLRGAAGRSPLRAAAWPGRPRLPRPGGAPGSAAPRRRRPGPGLFVPLRAAARLGGAGLAQAPRHRALPSGGAPPQSRDSALWARRGGAAAGSSGSGPAA